MAKHETVRGMTDGQRSDIIATMVSAMPSLSFAQAQAIIGNKGPFVVDIGDVFQRQRCTWHQQTTAPAPRSTPPADGVVFELTLKSIIDPMMMLRKSDGRTSRGWKFTGSPVTPQTRSFKLVRRDFPRNIDKVRRQLARYGSIPEGQWREAFKKAYPQSDGQGSIGFADPAWVHPGGRTLFPVLEMQGDDWRSYFQLAVYEDGDDYGRGDGLYELAACLKNWRWLVEVGK